MQIDQTLRKIASNLWIEWNANVHLLFRTVSPYVWSLFRRNLYRFLVVQKENPMLYQRRLMELLADPEFFGLLDRVEADFQAYMNPRETAVSQKYPELSGHTLAYFSMEYGMDILPIYSGGLGILSGDHLRGASDIGLPLVGVGLFYLQGYYEQQVKIDGTMRAVYEPIVPFYKAIHDYLPLNRVKKAGTHDDLVVDVAIGDRTVRAYVWRVRMGRIDLLLLDSNHPDNLVHDRHITRRLYASQKRSEEERQRRLEQEMLLGIGGVRALIGAGIRPSAYHLNEGHVALAALEILKRHKETGISFKEARARTAAQVGFTTHTPVPEGNERFAEDLVRRNLTPYLDTFLNSEERETLFNCARNREEMFDMTKLSLLLSGAFRNGVSQLHGEVCRKMWAYAWEMPDTDHARVPIASITNAVHLPYWQKPLLRELLKEHGGLGRIGEIPNEKIWRLHEGFRAKLIEKVRERYAYQLISEDLSSGEIHEKTLRLLDMDSFMIGFARRFAQYKRVTMFLEDEERLFHFLENAYRTYGKPVQILYAGKPHPNNLLGVAQIRQIYGVSRRLAKRCEERDFRAQIVFIPGYDIDLARYLEAGVDVWLNNPIRPLEASGTSGMKAAINGVLNVSVPDGWTPEGIRHGVNGWLFGRGDADSTAEDRDELFRLLEQTVLPLYFERPTHGRPFSDGWVEMMKHAIFDASENFNTDRMLFEYTEKMYLPAVRAAVAQTIRRTATEEVK